MNKENLLILYRGGPSDGREMYCGPCEITVRFSIIKDDTGLAHVYELDEEATAILEQPSEAAKLLHRDMGLFVPPRTEVYTYRGRGLIDVNE